MIGVQLERYACIGEYKGRIFLKDRIIYEESQIQNSIDVPDIVTNELLEIIEEVLEKCGLYYRTFCRVKAAKSMTEKLNNREKGYGKDKKVQDMIGIRIGVYFRDDVEICQRMMEHCFELVDWSMSDIGVSEFKPTKINGVFRLPNYIAAKISEETWKLPIDSTFEIQFKTMFSEGWHEIEHDMQYKGRNLWEGKQNLARNFNSILATLELCDNSLVSLFEDLGHQHYKERNWTAMIRSHYRIRLTDQAVLKEIEDLFNRNIELAKLFFKFKRIHLMELLVAREEKIKLSANSVIAIINENIIKNQDLSKIIQKNRDIIEVIDIEEDKKNINILQPMKSHVVFSAKTGIVHCKKDRYKVFEKAAGYIYDWIKLKYSNIFPEMSKSIKSYFREENGFQVGVLYKPQESFFAMSVFHPGINVPGRMWHTEAAIVVENEKLQLIVENSFAESENDRKNEQDVDFSRPSFYGKIADKIGLIDVLPLKKNFRYVEENTCKELVELIQSKERKFPVIVIEEEKGNAWLEEFDIENFSKIVRYYAHVFVMSKDTQRKLGEVLKIKDVQPSQIQVYWPSNGKKHLKYKISYKDEIERFNYEVASYSHGKRRYKEVIGAIAFRYKLVRDIRQNNVLTHVDMLQISQEAFIHKNLLWDTEYKTEEDWKKLLTESRVTQQQLQERCSNLKQQVNELKKKLYQKEIYNKHFD